MKSKLAASSREFEDRNRNMKEVGWVGSCKTSLLKRNVGFPLDIERRRAGGSYRPLNVLRLH